MRVVVIILMMTIILLNIFPRVKPKHYLIKTATEAKDGNDYSGLADNVLDCANNNNYICRHMAGLFNKKRGQEEQKEEQEAEAEAEMEAETTITSSRDDEQ